MLARQGLVTAGSSCACSRTRSQRPVDGWHPCPPLGLSACTLARSQRRQLVVEVLTPLLLLGLLCRLSQETRLLKAELRGLWPTGGREATREESGPGVHAADRGSAGDPARQTAEGGARGSGAGTGEMSLAEYLTASGQVHADSPTPVDQSTDLQEIAGVERGRQLDAVCWLRVCTHLLCTVCPPAAHRGVVSLGRAGLDAAGAVEKQRCLECGWTLTHGCMGSWAHGWLSRHCTAAANRARDGRLCAHEGHARATR